MVLIKGSANQLDDYLLLHGMVWMYTSHAITENSVNVTAMQT